MGTEILQMNKNYILKGFNYAQIKQTNKQKVTYILKVGNTKQS